MLEKNPVCRLGSVGDAEEVKSHTFFAGVDWEAVFRKELDMPVPVVEPVQSKEIPQEVVFGDLKKVFRTDNKIGGWTFILE